MSDADYQAERDRIRAMYGDSGALRDQALALLFHRSHWTQEQLVKAEGCTQDRVEQWLRFGKFLSLNPGVPKNLREGRFRCYLLQIEGTDEQRFTAVHKLIEADLDPLTRLICEPRESTRIFIHPAPHMRQ